MYLFSRVAIGLCKLVVERMNINATELKDLSNRAYVIEATLVWGLVMWLFQHHHHHLQASLQASMEYLYVDSERWKDLATLLLFNK